MKKKHKFSVLRKFVILINSKESSKEELNEDNVGFGYEDIVDKEEKNVDHGLIFERLISKHDEAKKPQTLKDEISDLNQVKLSKENEKQQGDGEISFDNLLKDEDDLKLSITDEEINEITKNDPKSKSKYSSEIESSDSSNNPDKKTFRIQFVKDEKKPFIQKVEKAEKKEFIQEFV